MGDPHPDSKWTHPTCIRCYEIEEPDRYPAAVFPPDEEVCCFCGADTDDGIYYRADPKKVHTEEDSE